MRERLAINPIVAGWVRESTVLYVILLNTVVLFLDAFPGLHRTMGLYLFWIDYASVIFFVIEALFKIGLIGFQRYWRSPWNRFDFLIVLAGLPILISPFLPVNRELFEILLFLRVARFLRAFRLARFIPNAAEVGRGLMRALKASVGVFLVLFGLNLIFAMGATLFFGHLSPRHFGDPMISLYTLFKVFTIEGWYEIPDQIAANGGNGLQVVLLRLYFVVSVLTGGILGLSLANAVFVDEMTADNNMVVERMVADLQLELAEFRAQSRLDQQSQTERLQIRLEELQREVARLSSSR